jgi:uroporphyrinogen-III decarboxylase
VGDVVLSEVKALHGTHVALLGGLDPVYTFDLGTAQDVRNAIRQAIADAGRNGGYIIGTGEAVAPRTPIESLQAATEATKTYGVYGRDL